MRRSSPGAFSARLRAALGVAVAPAFTALPVTAQSADQVTIHRDPWGVPHIIADTEEAGFYGLGYAQAEDQLEFILTPPSSRVVMKRGDVRRQVF